MWFFMITCYLLSVLSTMMLFVTGIQGYYHLSVLGVNHPTFALLTIIIYLFTQTLVIFYFVGIGVSIRDYTQEHKLNGDYHKRSITIKRKIYPPVLLNMLLVMGLFVSGGAVHTGWLPGWLHGILFLAGLFHYLRTLLVEHTCFRDATHVVLDMSGVLRVPKTPGT